MTTVTGNLIKDLVLTLQWVFLKFQLDSVNLEGSFGWEKRDRVSLEESNHSQIIGDFVHRDGFYDIEHSIKA